MTSPADVPPQLSSAAVSIRALLLVTFIESAATALIERGIFFYTEHKLGFTEKENLWLALVFAMPYVVAALGAHAVTTRWLSEKALTVIGIAGQTLFLAAVAVHPVGWTIFAAQAVMGFCTGLKWPPIESYISAGLTPTQASRRIGVFNVTWAGAVPIAIVLAGPLIEWWDRALFIVPPILSMVSFLFMMGQPSRPIHLPDDHPERPSDEHLAHMRGLLHASRWLLFGSYAIYFVLAAVMPKVFDRLDVAVRHATMLSAIIEVMRVVAFFGMQRWSGWHFKAWPLVASMICVPAGFVLIVSTDDLSAVLIGEVLFGVAMGLTYYCALYYAMVVKNAAVDAGGLHEGLIGIGFVAGPIAALIGHEAAAVESIGKWGVYLGVGPLMLVMMIFATRPLIAYLFPNLRTRDASAAED